MADDVNKTAEGAEENDATLNKMNEIVDEQLSGASADASQPNVETPIVEEEKPVISEDEKGDEAEKLAGNPDEKIDAPIEEAEQPKIEEPIVEEEKPSEPVEQPKIEEPIVEEEKPAEPVEQPKVETPIVEGDGSEKPAEQPKVETGNGDDADKGDGADKEEKTTIDHALTQEDLDNNPEFEKEGLKVGDIIQIEKEAILDEEIPAEIVALIQGENLFSYDIVGRHFVNDGISIETLYAFHVDFASAGICSTPQHYRILEILNNMFGAVKNGKHANQTEDEA